MANARVRLHNTSKSTHAIYIIACVAALVLALYAGIVTFPSGTVAVSSAETAQLQILFFPLGNPVVGDSCIITIGDCQILVDAGSNGNSCTQINEQIANVAKTNSTDSIWDYVIATHQDQDHIAAFATGEHGIDYSRGVLDYIVEEHKSVGKQAMTIGTLIDFDWDKDDTISQEDRDVWLQSISGLCKTYRAKRDLLKSAGKISNYYTASQCCWEQREDLNSAPVPGATNVFNLPNGATLTILYNEYYHTRLDSGKMESAEKNCQSVCFLITYGTQRFLFTGDLEEYDSTSTSTDYGYERSTKGETKLFENNKALLSKGVTFYKAAHHGSRTSNSQDFIDKIHPEIVVIPTIAGTTEHSNSDPANRFPAQCVLSRFLAYTDTILIPEQAEIGDDGKMRDHTPYYGKCLVVSDGKSTHAYATGDGDDYKLANSIVETEWFRENREDNPNNYRTPKVYVFSGYVDENNTYFGNCTLIKYKHYDILFDCGVYGTIGGKGADCAQVFASKVHRYCRDQYLDYLVITSPYVYSIQQLVDLPETAEEEGIMSAYEVGTLIDGGITIDPSSGKESSKYALYEAQVAAEVAEGAEYFNVSSSKNLNQMRTKGKVFEIAEDFSLCVLANEYYGMGKQGQVDGAISCCVCYGPKKMLIMGDISARGEASIVAKNDLSGTVFFSGTDHGNENANSSALLQTIQNRNLCIAINVTAGESVFGKVLLNKNTCNKLLNTSRNVYITTQKNGWGNYQEVNGDIIYDAEDGSVETSTGLPLRLKETLYYKTAH